MNHLLPKQIFLCTLLAALFLGPSVTDAQTSSVGASWLSKVFDWQSPLVGHISNLFETRKDNVESTSAERNRLIDWRRGNLLIETATVSPALANGSDATSSPAAAPYSFFEERQKAISVELLSADNGLKASRSTLASFIKKSSTNGKDMSAAEAALAKADAAISIADSDVTAFQTYEPTPANPSDSIDLRVPQSDLDSAIAAINLARTALTSAIVETGDSQ